MKIKTNPAEDRLWQIAKRMEQALSHTDERLKELTEEIGKLQIPSAAIQRLAQENRRLQERNAKLVAERKNASELNRIKKLRVDLSSLVEEPSEDMKEAVRRDYMFTRPERRGNV